MTRESDPNNTFIGDFQNTAGVVDLPETDGTILVSEVDDQIRDAKQMIYNTFKSCDGEVTATHTELNNVDGVQQNLALWMKGKTAAGLAVATGSGTPTTYVLTTGESHTLADGDVFTFKASVANTGEALLQVDSNAAKNLAYNARPNVENIDTDAIGTNNIVKVIYDSTFDKFVIIGGLYNPNVTSTSETFFSGTGSDTYVVPTGVTQISFILIGGGGGGGAGGNGSGSSGGGGSGACIYGQLSVNPGESIPISAGAGGGGGTGNNGQSGTPSTLEYDGTTYSAGPGGGGLSTSSSSPRAGGDAGSWSVTSGTPQATFKRNGKRGGDGSTINGSDGGGGAGGSGMGLNNEEGQDSGDGANGGQGSANDNPAAGGVGAGDDGDDATNPPTVFDANGGGGGAGHSESNKGGDGGLFGAGGGGSSNNVGGGSGGDGGDGLVAIWT